MGGAIVEAAGAEAAAAMPWLRSYPPGVSWEVDFPAETLPGVFDAAVARFGPRTLLDFMGRRWSFAATGAERMADVVELLRELLIGSVIFLNDAPIAIQLVYRVEAPEWISVEYINGGVDPETRDFSPGSVLSFLNTQSAWEDARALGKPLRFSFGRADREYKDRWCNPVPVFQV